MKKNNIFSLKQEKKLSFSFEFGTKKIKYPIDKTIHQLFEEQVRKYPEQVAIIFGKSIITYRQLNKKANQIAHFLKEKGTKPDTLIAIACDRSIDMVVGIIAILKSGGAYVPLDSAYPIERISYIIDETKALVFLIR